MAGLLDLLQLQNLTGGNQFDAYGGGEAAMPNDILSLIQNFSAPPQPQMDIPVNDIDSSGWGEPSPFLQSPDDMGMPASTSISNLVQTQLGAKQPPQPTMAGNILANRFAEPTGIPSGDSMSTEYNWTGPTFGNYASAINEAYHGGAGDVNKIVNSQVGDQLKLMAAMNGGGNALKAAQLGGARGGLIQQYMMANPGATFNQALAATGPLMGQGVVLNEQNQAIPLTGYGAAKSDTLRQAEAAKKEGQGEITDVQKRERGQSQMGTIINNMKSQYQKLKEMKAITSSEFDPAENLAISGTQTSNAAQAIRGRMATPDAVVRQNINNMIPRLMTSIKSSTGMSAQEINSIPEMQLLKESVGNPKQPVETVLSTLDELMALYGPAQNEAQNNNSMNNITPQTNNISLDELLAEKARRTKK